MLEGVRNKDAGMSLEQISVLLDADAPERHRVLQAHLDDLERRMAEMERSREMTQHALQCRAHDVASCPNFQRFVSDLVDAVARKSEVADAIAALERLTR